MKRFKTHNLFKLLATGLIFVQFFVVGSVGAVDSMDTDDDGLKQMTTDYTDVDGGEIREDANVGLGFEIDESQAIDISEAVPVKAGDLMQVKSFSGDGEVSVEKVEQMGAMEVGDKLMEYYDGIEENTMDYILYYLAQNQNEDGSFSSFNQYEITSEIGYLLARFNRRGSDEYQAMVDYLLTTAPSNNREKAIKARVLLDQGGDNSGLLTELMASRNSDGGVGLEEGYGSDVVTTLEVVKAFAKSSDFETGGAATQGLYYVLNQVEADGSMSYFPDGADSYYLVNKTLEYIKPFEGVTVSNRDSININVDEKINALLGFLNNNYNQETEELAGSGLVDELGMLYGFQLYEYEPGVQAMLWDNNISEQYANGSFGDFYYDIAALKVFGQGDLGITGLEALTGLINKEDALFGIVLENRGYKAVSSPAFYAFVDDFARYNPLIINDTIGPNETWILEWDPVNTLPFIGDTKFTFYIEAEGEINYENNWKEDVFNFAGSLDGTPATPLYVVAVKLEYSDTPAVFLQTPFKDDANRYAYRMIYRKLGDETWRSRIIDSQYGRFVTNLPEDEVWEFSIGAEIVTRGPVYYSEIVQVMTSSDNAKYTGDFSGYVTFNNQREQGAEVDGEGLHATYVESDEEGNFSYQNRGNGVTVVWAGNNYHQKIATRVIIPNGGETTDIRLITRFAPDTEAPEIMSVYISKSTDNSVPNQEEVSVLVNSVYDDYPKEADVYYYEPSDDSWNYISTTEFDFGVVSFDWYVPGALLGEGYKLKAIIWDWQGNVSEPMESDPFDVRQGGEASEPEPEIELGQATTTVASGGSFDVGSVEVGTSSETVFDIYNLGDADLVLNSSTTVVISGDDAGDFSVVGGPSDTIAPAGSSDFTLIFSPSLAGVKNVDLSISNNDNNENPYIVLIIGEGIGEASSTASEINVKEDGINISSGETLIFGNENTEEYIEKTLVIENLGDADLILGEEALVTIVGADANQFVIATEPETPISANASTTVILRFAPTSAGLKQAEFRINNNDSDENPYIINLSGVGEGLAYNYQAYLINPRMVNKKLILTSLEDGNEVILTFNGEKIGETYNLDERGRVIIPALYSYIRLKVSGTKPFTVYNKANTTEALITEDFLGKNFVYPNMREGKVQVYYLYNSGQVTANVQIIKDTTEEVTIDPNRINIFNAGTYSEAATVISSDSDILVFHRALGSLDGVNLFPATTTPIFGVMSNNYYLTALEDGTEINIKTTANPSLIKTISLQRGEKIKNVLPNGVINTLKSQGQGLGIMLNANKPIAAFQQADGDGSDATTFLPKELFFTKTVVSTKSEYISVITTTPNTTVEVKSKSGNVITSKMSGDNQLDKLYFIHNRGYFWGQTRVEASAPIYAIYEDYGTNDERNLMGVGGDTFSEINIKENGINISSGETLLFGNENTEEYTEKTLVIENLGDADLVLGEEALVTIVGADADQFVIATEPETPISANASTTMVLRFAPTSAGLKQAEFRINNNDSDENPYIINLSGVGEGLTYNHRAYLVNSRSVNKNLILTSLEDGNEVILTLNGERIGEVYNLNKRGRVLIPGVNAQLGLKVSGTKQFTIYDKNQATEALISEDFKGKSFVYPNMRSRKDTRRHEFYILNLGRVEAQVDITSEELETKYLEPGKLLVYDAGPFNDKATIIESSEDVLVMHRTNSKNDAVNLYPATISPVYGIMSMSYAVAASFDNTEIIITTTADPSAVKTIYLDRGEVALSILPDGIVNLDRQQGRGLGIKLTADKPIVAFQYADGDGSDATTFLPEEMFFSQTVVPTKSQYISVITTTPNTTVEIKNKSGGVIMSKTSGDNQLQKLYFIHNRDYFWGQTRVEASAPIYAIYEDYGTNDERNLMGVK